MMYTILFMVRRFYHYITRFLYLTSLCFSSWGRYFYHLHSYCWFLILLFFGKTLISLTDLFCSFFIIWVIYSSWIFRRVHICEKSYKKKSIIKKVWFIRRSKTTTGLLYTFKFRFHHNLPNSENLSIPLNHLNISLHTFSRNDNKILFL